jgi:hypothetical protein
MRDSSVSKKKPAAQPPKLRDLPAKKNAKGTSADSTS